MAINTRSLAVLGMVAGALLLLTRRGYAMTAPLDLTAQELQSLTLSQGTNSITVGETVGSLPLIDLPESLRGDYESDSNNATDTVSAESVVTDSQSNALATYPGLPLVQFGLQVIPSEFVPDASTFDFSALPEYGPGESPGNPAANGPVFDMTGESVYGPGDTPGSTGTASQVVDVDSLVVAVADWLKAKEGLVLFVYDDATAPPRPWSQSKRGKPTIGYGHLVKPSEPLDWVLPDEGAAYALLLADVRERLLPLISAVHVPLSVRQWIGLVSWAFNVGVGAVLKSTALKLLNAGDFMGAMDSWATWNKITVSVDGVLTKVISQGLVNRRAYELALFSQSTPVVYLA